LAHPSSGLPRDPHAATRFSPAHDRLEAVSPLGGPRGKSRVEVIRGRPAMPASSRATSWRRAASVDRPEGWAMRGSRPARRAAVYDPGDW